MDIKGTGCEGVGRLIWLRIKTSDVCCGHGNKPTGFTRDEEHFE
jgi:hypothetical protein